MSAPAPGWYPDGSGGLRWWNGAQWSDATAPATPTATAVSAAPAVAVPIAGVPAGTPAYTAWIWWIVLLPVASVVPAIGYLIDVQSRMIEFVRWSMSAIGPDGSLDRSLAAEMVSRELGLVFTPWYLALVLVGLVTMALTVVFAYLDHRDLQRLGYVRPFHWAWSFFALAGYGIVYVIGRSVVVRRRSGRGLAPMWVAIGLIVASFLFALVWMGWFMSTFMQQMPGLIGSVPS